MINDFMFEKIALNQMQNLWLALGTNLRPFVLYKMRVITNEVDENIKSIT